MTSISSPQTSGVNHYFDQFWQTTQRAIAGPSARIHHFEIADQPVRVVYSDLELEKRLLPAMRHLRMDKVEEPALTVYSWESFNTQGQMPEPTWGEHDYDWRGQVIGFNTADIRTVNMPRNDGFNMLHLGQGLGLQWNPDVRRINLHQQSFPLRVIINWWALAHGFTFAHAGAVGHPDGGVLIVGHSGMGKSSTALACLGAGMHYVSDDHVLLSFEPEPYVYGLYQSAKLHEEQVERLPWLGDYVTNRDDPDADKALFFVDQFRPELVSKGFPLKAVLVPRVTGLRETTLTRISGKQAMLTLAPSSLILLPGDAKAAFSRLAEVVRRVPCYEIALGTDMMQIPARIDSLLSEL